MIFKRKKYLTIEDFKFYEDRFVIKKNESSRINLDNGKFLSSIYYEDIEKIVIGTDLTFNPTLSIDFLPGKGSIYQIFYGFGKFEDVQNIIDQVKYFMNKCKESKKLETSKAAKLFCDKCSKSEIEKKNDIENFNECFKRLFPFGDAHVHEVLELKRIFNKWVK